MPKNERTEEPLSQALDGISQIKFSTISELLACGKLNENYRNPDHRQFYIITKGSGVVVLDNEAFRIRSGTVIVIPSNCRYQFRLKPGADGVIFSGTELFMRTRVAQALFTTSSTFSEPYYKPHAYNVLEGPQQRKKRGKIFAEIGLAAKRLGLGCDASVMSYILVLLAEDSMINRFATGWETTPRVESSEAGLLYQYQILVERHFREHLPMQDYYRMLRVNRNKLLQTCKTISGFTPLELLHNRVMLEAKRELLSTPKTINEITYNLGFSDCGYFSRFFKNRTGLSPAHFRSLSLKTTPGGKPKK